MKVMDEDTFIEAASRVFGAGMPPMAGRMWAYLAICEPPNQTAAMIAERLHASRGSVSGIARLLEQVGLIRRPPGRVTGASSSTSRTTPSIG